MRSEDLPKHSKKTHNMRPEALWHNQVPRHPALENSLEYIRNYGECKKVYKKNYEPYRRKSTARIMAGVKQPTYSSGSDEGEGPAIIKGSVDIICNESEIAQVTEQFTE